mmetsp:Transcript_44556/g.96873  ORF Transcript_44556/g.96873 Transcript_44556/m.96873 type:complete len:96 (+) Transcript_44556:192-479(+)
MHAPHVGEAAYPDGTQTRHLPRGAGMGTVSGEVRNMSSISFADFAGGSAVTWRRSLPPQNYQPSSARDLTQTSARRQSLHPAAVPPEALNGGERN